MPITITYNQNLKNYARENRQIETLSEKIFWHIVRNKKLNGLKFQRQKIVGEYIVDFICIDTGVVIEIDGLSHKGKSAHDSNRDIHMQGLGLNIIRISDKDVTNKTDNLLTYLSKHPLLQKPIPERHCVFVPSPPPSPQERVKIKNPLLWRGFR